MATTQPGEAGSLGIGSLKGGEAVNHLLRSLAPITARGWEELEQEARRRLTPALASRRLVDFAGPHGWDRSATNLGRTEPVAGGPVDGVAARRRIVLPVVELRAPFTVARSELADIDRGAEDPDLESLGEAARRMALAENTAVFGGAEAGLTGSPARRHTSRSRWATTRRRARRTSPGPSRSCSAQASAVPTGWRSARPSTPP